MYWHNKLLSIIHSALNKLSFPFSITLGSWCDAPIFFMFYYLAGWRVLIWTVEQNTEIWPVQDVWFPKTVRHLVRKLKAAWSSFEKWSSMVLMITTESTGCQTQN